MKTPREILLERHKAADTGLDEIRQAVVADLSRRADEPRIPFVLKLWRELIWPCRRTWAGLAAAWLAMAVFNLPPAGQSQIAAVTVPANEMRLTLREQHRVLDEIIGPSLTPPPVAAPRPPANRPRSERSKRRSAAMA